MLTGTNGLINVTEQNVCFGGACLAHQKGFSVIYSLNILDQNSSIAITAFGVSTNTKALYPGAIWANRLGWTGQQISAKGWSTSLFATSGSYSSLFGNGFYVNIFDMTTSGSAITTANDAVFEFFHFMGLPDSQFVALSANGTIVDQSLGANKVPEPAPLALLGFGLLGIGLIRKRRRS